jgi:hypothetical protein
MAQTSPQPGTPRPSGPGSAWAAGGAMFAGVLLVVDGVLGILKGIAGIAEDDVYTRFGDYVYKFNLTAWGWINLVLGVILVATGSGILRGAGWARALGVALASLSIVADFIWLPYQPIWALVSIAIAVFVIWALCTDRTNAAAQR